MRIQSVSGLNNVEQYATLYNIGCRVGVEPPAQRLEVAVRTELTSDTLATGHLDFVVSRP